MKCCAFGVANHSPEDVVSELLRCRIASKAADIGILPPGSRADTRHKFLLLLSTADFSRNLKVFDDTSVRIFIFSNPIDLSAFVGVRNLDFTPTDDFSFTYTKLDLSPVAKSMATSVKKVPNEFLKRLIENVRHGSLLNPLMTFIYSLSSQHQNEVKLMVFSYLYKGGDASKFIAALSSVLSERSLERLTGILSTTVAQSYATALRELRAQRKGKKPLPIEQVAESTSTSAYELSYILSVLESEKKTKYSDSFDKAKNRKTIHRKRA